MFTGETETESDTANFAAFINTFSPGVWVTMAMTIMAQLTCVLICKASTEQSVNGSILSTLVWYRMASCEKSLTLRLIFISGALSIVTFSAYNADLTTYLTVKPKPQEFDTLEAVAESNFLLSGWKHGSIYSQFEKYPGWSTEGQIFARLKASSQPFNTACDASCVATKLKVCFKRHSQLVESFLQMNFSS